jgi:endo-1,4-beta-xylanase
MLNEQLIKYEELVNIYKKTVPKSQQYGITLWGFNDRDTWINRFFKIKDWPCIYDEKLNPKPAFYGFLNGLKN